MSNRNAASSNTTELIEMTPVDVVIYKGKGVANGTGKLMMGGTKAIVGGFIAGVVEGWNSGKAPSKERFFRDAEGNVTVVKVA